MTLLTLDEPCLLALTSHFDQGIQPTGEVLLDRCGWRLGRNNSVESAFVLIFAQWTYLLSYGSVKTTAAARVAMRVPGMA